ncbi:hypothetical protein [Asticcacaulis machinosus]|uniref:Uncharacterized protein n=1 Tax=Asticcacaulis machinosus TaxID=2984211 RepID=A0ABT5HN53_9CAUL|nr:hypothetical protein [Asticcacaulis machinosus]MDC7677592.1 hypothetical protein [Asticcacaulis machinosus]
MTSTRDTSNLPVPVGPVIDHEAASGPKTRRRQSERPQSGFTAQILGGGEKRGLKGGAETLAQAKTTYLKSEYSGHNDRRPQAGIIKKTEI